MATRADSRRLPIERETELSDLAECVVGTSDVIEPLNFAHEEGITTSFGDYGDAFDGLLEAKAGAFHLYCNLKRVEEPDSTRARFTLAHELGHYFIDEHRNALLAGRAPSHPSFCDYLSSHLVEVEADCFASCLLMPSSRFRIGARRASKGLSGILGLSASYRTSLTATAIRYLQMDLFQGVMVRWDADGKYLWKRLSPAAYVGGLRKTVESTDRLPRDCPTVSVLKGAAGIVEKGTTKSTWFPFVDASSDRNTLFFEQAISLGRFGALTFLYPLD